MKFDIKYLFVFSFLSYCFLLSDVYGENKQLEFDTFVEESENYEILISEGRMYRDKQELENAIQSWEHALTLLSLKNDSNINTYIDLWLDLSNAYQKLGYYNKALDHAEDILVKIEKNRMNDQKMLFLNRLGDIYLAIGNISNAAKYIEESYKSVDSLKGIKPEIIASVYNNYANLKSANNHLERAIYKYNEALHYLSTTDNLNLISKIQLNKLRAEVCHFKNIFIEKINYIDFMGQLFSLIHDKDNKDKLAKLKTLLKSSPLKSSPVKLTEDGISVTLFKSEVDDINDYKDKYKKSEKEFISITATLFKSKEDAINDYKDKNKKSEEEFIRNIYQKSVVKLIFSLKKVTTDFYVKTMDIIKEIREVNHKLSLCTNVELFFSLSQIYEDFHNIFKNLFSDLILSLLKYNLYFYEDYHHIMSTNFIATNPNLVKDIDNIINKNDAFKNSYKPYLIDIIKQEEVYSLFKNIKQLKRKSDSDDYSFFKQRVMKELQILQNIFAITEAKRKWQQVGIIFLVDGTESTCQYIDDIYNTLKNLPFKFNLHEIESIRFALYVYRDKAYGRRHIEQYSNWTDSKNNILRSIEKLKHDITNEQTGIAEKDDYLEDMFGGIIKVYQELLQPEFTLNKDFLPVLIVVGDHGSHDEQFARVKSILNSDIVSYFIRVGYNKQNINTMDEYNKFTEQALQLTGESNIVTVNASNNVPNIIANSIDYIIAERNTLYKSINSNQGYEEISNILKKSDLNEAFQDSFDRTLKRRGFSSTLNINPKHIKKETIDSFVRNLDDEEKYYNNLIFKNFCDLLHLDHRFHEKCNVVVNLLYKNLLAVKNQAEKSSDYKKLSICYGHIGKLYMNDFQYRDAEALTQKAIDYAMKVTKSKNLIYLWYWQMARILKYQKKMEEAKRYYQKSVEILNSRGNMECNTIKNNFFKGYRNQDAFYSNVKLVYLELSELLLEELEKKEKNSLIVDQEKEKYLKQIISINEKVKRAELENFYQDECFTVDLYHIKNIDDYIKKLNEYVDAKKISKDLCNAIEYDLRNKLFIDTFEPMRKTKFLELLEIAIGKQKTYNYEEILLKSAKSGIDLMDTNAVSKSLGTDSKVAIIYPILLPKNLLLIYSDSDHSQLTFVKKNVESYRVRHTVKKLLSKHYKEKEDDRLYNEEYKLYEWLIKPLIDKIASYQITEKSIQRLKKEFTFTYNNTRTNDEKKQNEINIEEIEDSNLLMNTLMKGNIFKNKESFKSQLKEVIRKELPQQYLSLILKHFRKIDTLLIIPNGIFHLVPYAAIKDREDDKFLIQKYAIAISPTTIISNLKPLDRQKTMPLLMGISEFEDESLTDLPKIKHELENLKKTINENTANALVLLNDKCSIESLRYHLLNNNYNILHIATHGNFGGTLEESCLYMRTVKEKKSKEIKVAGKDLEELFNLRRRTNKRIEMLVMSACQTATGNERAVLGLAGIAFKSGVSSVISTLSKVNDCITQETMSNFYQNLLTNPYCSKAQALQDAQKYIIKNKNEIAGKCFGKENDKEINPKDWSPFILIGNWL